MHSPKKNRKSKNSSISVMYSHIPKNNPVSSSLDIKASINDSKNISNNIPSKINTLIEFIKQKKKFALLNSFNKKRSKQFLEQKEKALIEIKLDDEILEENNTNELEYMRNNNKKKCNSLKRKSEYIINSKNNLESDINCNNNKIYENIGKKPKKEIKTKEKKIKNQIIIKKCSTAKLKVYDDNIKSCRNSLNFSPKRRTKKMKSSDDIGEFPISKDNIEIKNNNVKLLGKNYKEIFNEEEKEIINNSKIDSVRIILEELM